MSRVRLKHKEQENKRCTLSIVQIGENECKVEVLFLMPLALLKMTSKKQKEAIMISQPFRMIACIHQIFQDWRTLETMDKLDGVIMGSLLTAKSTSAQKNLSSRMEEFWTNNRSMAKLSEENKFFKPLINSIVLHRKSGGPGHMGTSLKLLTEQHGEILGRQFNSMLNAAATEEGAVQSWLKKYPLMVEFSERHSFFLPMLYLVGKDIKHAVTWEKLASSAIAAAFALFDVITDLYTINYYYDKGMGDTGFVMLTFVGVSLLLQLGLVTVIHHKNSSRWRFEILATLTYTKPAFNKFRVLTNQKSEGHELMPPVTEMVCFKILEVFCESIPVSFFSFSLHFASF